MTLKMKLISMISAFMLVLGLMLIGIYAVNQISVDFGGNISFTATDVYARVTGQISNAGEGSQTLPILNFDAGMTDEEVETEQARWSGLNLVFDEDATPITIEVTVENLSISHTLRVNLTDNTTSNENLEIAYEQDDEPYINGDDITLPKSTGDGSSTTTYLITFSIPNPNFSLPRTYFSIDINLYDESYVSPEITGFVFFLNDDDHTALVNTYTGSDTIVTIPPSISVVETDSGTKYYEGNQYTVTSIADYAFSYWGYLSRVAIPATIQSIGSQAFRNCFSLRQIEFEGTLEQYLSINMLDSWLNEASHTLIINGEEISGNLEIPDTVTIIPNSAFYGCTSITSITIPSSVTKINNYAFWYCFSLSTITIDSETIYNNATSDYVCGGLLSTSRTTTVRVLADFARDDHEYINTTNFPNVDKDVVIDGKTYWVYTK